MTFSGTLHASNDVDLFQVLTFDEEVVASQRPAEAQAVAQVAGGVAEDFLIAGALNKDIASGNPAVPLFPVIQALGAKGWLSASWPSTIDCDHSTTFLILAIANLRLLISGSRSGGMSARF